MKRELWVKPLGTWTVHGKTYTAAEPYLLHAPGELDGQFTTPVDKWTKIPGTSAQALAIGARFKRQSENNDKPTLQRYQLEFRDEVNSEVEMEALFADVPVIGADGKALPPAPPRSIVEKALADAIEKIKSLEGELESEREVGSSSGDEVVRLTATIEELSSSNQELQSAAEKAGEENKRLEEENAELRAKVEAAEKAVGKRGR